MTQWCCPPESEWLLVGEAVLHPERHVVVEAEKKQVDGVGHGPVGILFLRQ